MSTQPRVLAGVPTSGQFAAGPHPETGTTLTPASPARRSPSHGELADLGVPAGTLSLLAPVEARSVLGSLSESDAGDRGRVRARVAAYLRWRDLATTGPLYADRARRIAAEATDQLEAARAGFEATRQGQFAGPGVLLAAEAEADLMAAVRRQDAAAEDLRYLTDPSWAPGAWRQPKAEDVLRTEWFARSSAHHRVSRRGYRGQVH